MTESPHPWPVGGSSRPYLHWHGAAGFLDLGVDTLKDLAHAIETRGLGLPLPHQHLKLPQPFVQILQAKNNELA
jgi:hypothetical protein